jgi:hypothetical protein
MHRKKKSFKKPPLINFTNIHLCQTGKIHFHAHIIFFFNAKFMSELFF